MRTLLILTVFLLGLTACHRSGTWNDDAKNWERAFQQTKPKGIDIVHSSYWRSPHFTYEDGFFFELAPNEEFTKAWMKSYDMIRAETDADKKQFFDPPAWFLPKNLDQYDVWKYPGPPDEYFRMFIDRKTGEIFLSDHQG